jgi:hypothetical protein
MADNQNETLQANLKSFHPKQIKSNGRNRNCSSEIKLSSAIQKGTATSARPCI